MRVGLIHGRFQPFHIGHLFLFEEMMKICNYGVILIGSVDKTGEDNPFTFKERFEHINKIAIENYRFDVRTHKKVFIGGNLDIKANVDDLSNWNVLLKSCCLSLCGHYPTDVFAGDEYNLPWENDMNVHKYNRYLNISGTMIRNLSKTNPEEAQKYLITCI